MNLDDMLQPPDRECCDLVVIEGEVIDGVVIAPKEEDEFEDDTDSTVEADLSSALSLLDDMWSMMEKILEKKDSRSQKLNYYTYCELERLCQECAAFLNEFDLNTDKEHNLNWKDVL